MSDPRSTNDIRMIAQSVAREQAELCEVHRAGLSDRTRRNADSTQANATAIAALTTNVATLATTVADMSRRIEDNAKRSQENAKGIGLLEDAVNRVKNRPALLAGIGALIGGLAPLLIELFSK